MEHSPSWETNQFSASQIPCIVWNLKVHYHLSLSWARSIQFTPPPSHFLKIHLNIILPSTSESSNCSLSLRFPHQNPVCSSIIIIILIRCSYVCAHWHYSICRAIETTDKWYAHTQPCVWTQRCFSVMESRGTHRTEMSHKRWQRSN